ncbi:MAG: hypothetical protein RLZZ127_64 [Planctomycetota bacterium]|jgi:hypothetical protein
MPFAQGFRDLDRAFREGRAWRSRFVKNAGPSGQNQWLDWTFSSGQPAYDARTGDAGAFTPCATFGNARGIYCGPLPAAGMTKHLIGWRLRSDTQGGTEFVQLYDLIGYYPLIDGDSTDPQDLDNANPLPRYADGDGVDMVLVNHVAPAAQDGTAIIDFDDHAGVSRQTTVRLRNDGQNKVVSSQSATSTGVCSLAIPLANGSRGVRRATRITYTVPPGGAHALMLIKPLAWMTANADRYLFQEQIIPLSEGWSVPQILDGACLNLFHYHTGGNNASALFGSLLFAWG